MNDPVPVVLFAFARPRHLARVLECLRRERVPLIYAFVDGSRGGRDVAAVGEVGAMLRGVDWCEMRLVERESNLGLGRNVLAGVSEVSGLHEAFVVWEDDLVCVPGTYAWVCEALRRYRNDPRVMSVTAWTHPLVTPRDVRDEPYCDGRAECWVWGGYARSWLGMEETALKKMERAEAMGIASDVYGADLPGMARVELSKNIWAVRWLYHHIINCGLTVRPPWSMVEHIGFDHHATNAANAERWANPRLRPCPPIPLNWPASEENPACRELWVAANPAIGKWTRVWSALIRIGGRSIRRVKEGVRATIPLAWRARLRAAFGWKWFQGDYRSWREAMDDSSGYDDTSILDRIVSATMAVRIGAAEYERDGVLFYEPEAEKALLRSLGVVRSGCDGELRVIDFGGSLGSSYWRHRRHLHGEGLCSWDVVEQSQFVEAGRRYFSEDGVRFYFNVSQAQAVGPHGVLLCSCVLQYLEDPWAMLGEWGQLQVPFLLLMNLPLHDDGPTRIRVQHVPPSIYPASYPVRFFNRSEFMQVIASDYEVVELFTTEATWSVDGRLYPSSGLLLRRRYHL